MGCSRKVANASVLLINNKQVLNMLNVSEESKNVHCNVNPG